MNETNPVVILDGDRWHIAENGRSSTIAHCGKAMRNRRSHSRVSTVGVANVCADCVRRYREDFPHALPDT